MPSHPFRPGDVISGYTIEQFLGSGGMGTVYRAANPTLPRSDALKVLRHDLSTNDFFRARFDREASLVATLTHPNIVTVYTRGEFDGHLWIAMQYVNGTDADKELHAGRMTPHRAVHVITEVASALDYAHRRGILHRDIKPANFLLAHEPDRNEEPVYLADFGIARARDDTAHLTTDGTVMASVAYAAPEALAGASIDGRADIYSLGCALFTLLTGKAPYSDRPGGVQALVGAHLAAPPPRPSALDRSLPRGFDEVVATAMAKTPQDRYQSARDLAVAADHALSSATTAQIGRAAVTGPFTPTQTGSAAVAPPPAQSPSHDWLPGAVSYPHTPPPGIHGATPVPSAPTSARRTRTITAAIAAIVVLVATAAIITFTDRTTESPYTAQTFVHTHGSTELRAAPTVIAALGPGDADALLSLNTQPAAILTPGALPSWIRDKLTGEPPILGFADTSAIKATHPDLIIDTGDVDDATYQKLVAIAPTITRPAESTAAWSWDIQLRWIAKILGRDHQADKLIDTAAAQSSDLKSQLNTLAGKSVAAVAISDSTISETLSPSNTADYLSAVGLRYLDSLRRGASDGPTRIITDRSVLYQLDSLTQVLLVIRTDKAAGNGGSAGLPKELGAYRGTMVIVDDPDLVAALGDPGGYLADQYLNAHLVPKLVSTGS